jgi:transposase
MEQLEYSKLYNYEQAAKAIGVSLAWIGRWVTHAIKNQLVLNHGSEKNPKITGADLKRVCMKRYAELEAEYHWRAFERVRAAEKGLPFEEEEV